MPQLIHKHINLILSFFLLVLGTISLYSENDPPDLSAELSLGIFPEEGDNIKALKAYTVFRYENGKKRQYLNSSSFLCRKENKPYGTLYDVGGILITDSSILQAIPNGAPMPLMQCELIQDYGWSDKVFHFIMYFILGLLLYLFNIKNNLNFEPLFFVMLTGMLFGLTVELIQDYFCIGRSFEFFDLLANLMGILSSYFMITFIYKKSDIQS